MLRRFGKHFAYVLIAALLLAQQGLALHGLAHGVDALKVAKQGQTDSRGLPADRLCDLCLTYAQFAAGAPAVPPVFAAPALDYAAPVHRVIHASAAVGRAYQSRAPPRAI